ncbi:divergent polysaccharide deacetylase family protein [Alkalihalobacillus sp. BA299]|uniref:divergent polysaccharide deacetylase family protein n=1 Tax=Alkalihalobacillus sp. BA299 TaxID=2815938 RepID=UPI001ADB82BB|nr:divergent polysaccharide deacetylase family protein [Alkalihalobacillus sp. BA299]
MKKVILFIILITFFMSLQLQGFAVERDKKNNILDQPLQVAIIIDDFGGDVKGVNEFFASKIPITVAIMPFLTNSSEQAQKAHELGLEVMLHLPLEPKKGKKSWLGPNPITSDLSEEEIRKRLTTAIESIPHVAGINNHMGSKIVEDEKIMRVILEVVKEYDLYVIDSGTSGKSVIPKLAENMNIPWSTRDIFLDDTHSSNSHVYKQMLKLAKVANKRGKAIGIGHVGIKGHETVKGVQSALSHFKELGIQIVPASHLLETKIEQNPERFWQSD